MASECTFAKLRANFSLEHCLEPVVYTDPIGRDWCAIHEPNDQRKAVLAAIAKARAAKAKLLEDDAPEVPEVDDEDETEWKH